MEQRSFLIAIYIVVFKPEVSDEDGRWAQCASGTAECCTVWCQTSPPKCVSELHAEMSQNQEIRSTLGPLKLWLARSFTMAHADHENLLEPHARWYKLSWRSSILLLAAATLTTIQKMFAEAGADNKIKSNYDMGPKFRGFSAVMDAE